MNGSPARRISVTVNGECCEVSEGMSVAELVAAVLESSRGVAVALNSEVVPRSAWTDTRVGPGDRIEVLTAAQGG
ncbi:MAG: sulfur carrier protein ThiS [Acidimicrobiales bacterium]|nr:sulfur carrier protein ThiS [Acidimicrobiales bacterium]